MLSVPAVATSSSRGMNTETSACCSMGPMAVRAVRTRSAPSKEKGRVAKTSVAMPSVWRCLRISPVAPPPVPPPRAVTITTVRTPSRDVSRIVGVSWKAARAEAGWPPVPRPASRLPPRSRKGMSPFPPACASVSIASARMPGP